MRNGFIYEVIDRLIESLNYLNLVEFFKFLAKRLTRQNAKKEELISNVNISIDIFIVLKWLVVLFIWLNNITGAFWTLLTFYLIWSNLHTYFYYHLWKKEKNGGLEKMRRRFVSLVLAISFSNVAFAYLYSKIFSENFAWKTGSALVDLSSLSYSFSQSLFIGSENVYPVTLLGEFLTVLQLIISFIFVVVILSASLPIQAEMKDKNGI